MTPYGHADVHIHIYMNVHAYPHIHLQCLNFQAKALLEMEREPNIIISCTLHRLHGPIKKSASQYPQREKRIALKKGKREKQKKIMNNPSEDN